MQLKIQHIPSSTRAKNMKQFSVSQILLLSGFSAARYVTEASL